MRKGDILTLAYTHLVVFILYRLRSGETLPNHKYKAARRKIFDILHKRKVITTSKALTINKFSKLVIVNLITRVTRASQKNHT